MAKTRNDWKSQVFNLANNMVAAFIFAAIVMVTTTLYSQYGPTWSHSIMQGIVSGFVVLSSCMLFRLYLALPLAQERITTENIEARLLEWIYKFRLTMKREPIQEAHFCVCVTTASNKHIYIARAKDDWNDYLEFWAIMAEAGDAEKKIIDNLSYDESSWILVNLKMELARMRMGYSGFTSLGSGYRIVKRIPITESLREDHVINLIWEMEAALNELFYLVVKDVHLAKMGKLVEVDR